MLKKEKKKGGLKMVQIQIEGRLKRLEKIKEELKRRFDIADLLPTDIFASDMALKLGVSKRTIIEYLRLFNDAKEVIVSDDGWMYRDLETYQKYQLIGEVNVAGER